MRSVLADQRVTELQQRGGAWLAGLTNSASGLAQRSPDCRYKSLCFDTTFGAPQVCFERNNTEKKYIFIVFKPSEETDFKAMIYAIFLLKS